MAGPDITAEHLREVLRYDQDTGVFTWLRSRRIRPGSIAGHVNWDGYVIINVGSRGIRAHRLAWLYVHGRWPLDQIDHIDGDRSNNILTNLREADNRLNLENQRHARCDSRLGILGVRPSKNKFQARIRVGKRLLNLGLFFTPEEAHAAYLEAKRRLHKGCTI
jgi:hypothetical protein